MSRINNKQLVLRAFSFFCSGIFIGTIGILSWILGCCYPNSVMMIKKISFYIWGISSVLVIVGFFLLFLFFLNYIKKK